MAVSSIYRSGGHRRDLSRALANCSIEVMPKTAEKVRDFRSHLPPGTRIYIAHLEDVSVNDMVGTAQRLKREGFEVMPHFSARLIPDHHVLEEMILRYREQGVDQALVLAGDATAPAGPFASSRDMLETGLFEKNGFNRIHVAGHPEGNPVLGGAAESEETSLRWKQDYAERTGVRMAIVTQFVFELAPVFRWQEALRQEGVSLPVHFGVAGPTRVPTLVKQALACGVGPSLGVLRKRALDLSRFLRPYTPDQLLADLAVHPEARVEAVHIFPFGGIKASTRWLASRRAGGAGG